jgi:hypothetical protein
LHFDVLEFDVATLPQSLKKGSTLRADLRPLSGKIHFNPIESLIDNLPQSVKILYQSLVKRLQEMLPREEYWL